jgi:ribonuclease J
VNVCIHRGAHQIGGTLVEFECNGERIVLDAGLPLNPQSVAQRDLLPDVPGLWAKRDGSLRGLVISHPHPDHYGLADLVDAGVPILMGDAAAAILAEAAFFIPSARPFPVADHLRHRETHRLGAFAVTPWLVDHSAFDAYALLVEADGRRLLYTGDVRAHGRKPDSLAAVARDVGPIDVLLMEGTRVQPGADDRSAITEPDVEDACATLFRQTAGMALTFYSPQNVDRLVSLYRAAKRSGRIFVMDLYAATIAAATERSTIPQAGWDNVRVYVPQSQRRRVIEHEAFERIEAVRTSRIYADELRDRAGDIVMTCRSSMLGELQRGGCLRRAAGIWSMWPGYLRRDAGQALRAQLERLGIPMTTCHASGHATPDDLRQFAAAVLPNRIVPIHTAHPGGFPSVFGDRVELRADGEWWTP